MHPQGFTRLPSGSARMRLQLDSIVFLYGLQIFRKTFLEMQFNCRNGGAISVWNLRAHPNAPTSKELQKLKAIALYNFVLRSYGEGCR